jgi:hypothetical protein
MLCLDAAKMLRWIKRRKNRESDDKAMTLRGLSDQLA